MEDIKFYTLDIIDYFSNYKGLSNIEKTFIEKVSVSIKSSEKYILRGDFHNAFTNKDIINKFNYKTSSVFEFHDFNLKRDVVILVVGNENKYYSEIINLLGVKESSKNGLLFIYFYKEDIDWKVTPKMFFLGENDISLDYNVSFNEDEKEKKIQDKIFLNYKNIINFSSNSEIEMYAIDKGGVFFKIPHILFNF